MQRKSLFRVIAILLVMSTFLIGCSQKTENEGTNETSSNLLNAEWTEVLSEANGQTVNMYMWGGSDTINRYIDEWIAPRLKDQTGVILKRIPMNDTKDIINQLLTEKQVDKSDGSMDIIWINGENFKAAKDHELLWGSFLDQLPNYNEYVNKDAANIHNDFGESIEGLEAPWGTAQFVFVYDQEKVENPPKSMDELKLWVKDNPGKFTYPAPPDFTGSAFVRHALYETTGGYEQYFTPLNEQENLDEKLMPLWNYFNDIERYLWREGKTYPESSAKLDQLFANGEVWMTMGYDPGRASAQIQKGFFPESAHTFVLDHGTLSNTHYLSIPFNSTHQEGAMAAINFMLSPDAQIAKLNPKHWGDLMAINPEKLSEEERNRLSEIDSGIATLPADVLANHRLPEIPAEYVNVIEKGWMEHVAKE